MNISLKAAREQSGMTQVQVAKVSGITERSYQRIESGKTTTVNTAIRIADTLNIKSYEDFKKVFAEALGDETTELDEALILKPISNRRREVKK